MECFRKCFSTVVICGSGRGGGGVGICPLCRWPTSLSVEITFGKDDLQPLLPPDQRTAIIHCNCHRRGRGLPHSPPAPEQRQSHKLTGVQSLRDDALCKRLSMDTILVSLTRVLFLSGVLRPLTGPQLLSGGRGSSFGSGGCRETMTPPSPLSISSSFIPG
jgi:hypothetical protein